MKGLAIFAAAVHLASASPLHNKPTGVLYFLDSNPAGASIVSLKIAQDGSLSDPIRTSTDGRGSVSVNSTGNPVQTDPLFSQDSVVVKGNRLFTVNAGSNTLASFYIPQHDPQHPVLTSKPVPSGGDFPNTVAYSDKHGLVCVAHTGTKAGVQCFTMSDCGSLHPSGNFKPLPVKQTVPPQGPPNTVSDILFNPSQTAVFVTVKGDGKNPGYIYVYPIENGQVSDKPVVSRPSELLVDFGTKFVSDSSAVITDAAYGASVVKIAHDWTVSVSHQIKVAGQGAICWAVYSRQFDSVYIFDSLKPDITTIDAHTGKVKYTIPGSMKGNGTFDSAELGGWLYSLQANPAVAAIGQNNKHLPQVSQYLDLSSLGPRSGWTGLAIWSESKKE